MPRVIYSAPNADPEMDGLEWTLDRGELISPELTEAQVARYLTIPGFRQVELPKPDEPAQGADPQAGDAPKPRGKPKPATDAGDAGEPQKE